VLKGIGNAMRRYPHAISLQVNACWAVRMLWESAESDGASRVLIATQSDAVSSAVVEALGRGDVFARLGSRRVEETKEVVAAMTKLADQTRQLV